MAFLYTSSYTCHYDQPVLVTRKIIKLRRFYSHANYIYDYSYGKLGQKITDLGFEVILLSRCLINYVGS